MLIIPVLLMTSTDEPAYIMILSDESELLPRMMQSTFLLTAEQFSLQSCAASAELEVNLTRLKFKVQKIGP